MNTIQNAGYPVVAKDDRHFVVSGQIRESLPPGEAQSRGGAVGGAGSDPKDLRDPPAPYEVDAVDAIVSLDRTTGDVRIDANAFTGIGSTAHSGYVKRSASTRGAATVRKMEVCSS